MLKNPPANEGDVRELGSIPGLGRFPGRREWQPTPVLLPGESRGQRSWVGCSPWGCTELDTTEVTWRACMAFTAPHPFCKPLGLCSFSQLALMKVLTQTGESVMLQRHLKLPHQLLLKTLLPQHAHLLVSTGKNLHGNRACSGLSHSSSSTSSSYRSLRADLHASLRGDGISLCLP